MTQLWKEMDKPLLISILMLFLIGMATLYAAVHTGDTSLWIKQGLYWVIGMGVFFLVCLIPLRMVAMISWPAYVVSLFFLVLVPMIGVVQMGARRWLDLGIINLQPSEMMKWALMLALAYWFAAREANTIPSLGVAAALVAIPAALTAIQPDLGTALVLMASASVIIFCAGLPWLWLGAMALIVLISLPIAYANLHEYQKDRIHTFIDPQSDPLGAGYHVIQSSIAIGSGGITGQGYLQGSQSRLQFLPEQHTDFIFAVLAEEGGLVEVTILLLIYGFMISRIVNIAAEANTRYSSMLCLGIATIFSLYTIVNIGMVSGMLPVVGVPLPFISYGGSALVTMLAALGMVMRTAIESKSRVSWQRMGSPLS